MLRILMWIVAVCAILAAIGWIGDGNNGAELGKTAGDAAHGMFEAISAFIRGAFG